MDIIKCGPRNGYATCPTGQCCSSWGECGKYNCHMQEYEDRTGEWRGKFDGKPTTYLIFIETVKKPIVHIPVVIALFVLFYAIYKCYQCY